MNRKLLQAALLPLVFALVVGSPLSASAKYECPLEQPRPCNCTASDGRVYLQCSSLPDRKQLNLAIAKMAGFGITELTLQDSNVTHISRDLFKNSPVSRIRVENCMMIYLFDRELEHSADTLTEITMYDVDFEGGLDWSVLDNLKRLRTLSVAKTGLEKIPYGMNELEIPVETLILEENRIENIYEFGFSNLKELKSLVLKNNLLHEFQRKMLPEPECGLQFFDLSYNRLSTLPDDMFDGLQELHTLFLGGNEFKVLGKTYMEKIYSSLYFLDASNNPLRCDCAMRWLLSEPRPRRLTGQCVLREGRTQPLKDLTREDFAGCFV